MKIFLDSANVADIRWAAAVGLVDGVTTSPALLAQEASGADPATQLAEICRESPGPVSADIVSVSADDMYREARDLARISDMIVIKIPLIEEGLVAMRRLAPEGIRINATLVFSPAQAVLAARAGAAFVSVGMTEVEATGQAADDLLADIRLIFDNYSLDAELLATSIRHPLQFIAAARVGADVTAVPTTVLKALLVHPLTDRGLDQVLNEWSRRIARARAGT